MCSNIQNYFASRCGKLLPSQVYKISLKEHHRMKSYLIWNISIIPPMAYVHPLRLLTSNLHSLRSETAFRIGKNGWNIKPFVNMMELGFYMASTCLATQIVSINLLNKRTLFAKLKKKHLHIQNKVIMLFWSCLFFVFLCVL